MRPMTESDLAAGLTAIAAGRTPKFTVYKVAPKELPKAPPPPVERSWVRSSILSLDELPKSKPRPLKALLHAVSEQTKVGTADIQSARRSRNIVRARMIFYTIARDLTGASMPQIGRRCGGRDHSTILHGLRVVAEHPERFEPELSRLKALFAEEEKQP